MNLLDLILQYNNNTFRLSSVPYYPLPEQSLNIDNFYVFKKKEQQPCFIEGLPIKILTGLEEEALLRHAQRDLLQPNQEYVPCEEDDGSSKALRLMKEAAEMALLMQVASANDLSSSSSSSSFSSSSSSCLFSDNHFVPLINGSSKASLGASSSVQLSACDLMGIVWSAQEKYSGDDELDSYLELIVETLGTNELSENILQPLSEMLCSNLMDQNRDLFIGKVQDWLDDLGLLDDEDYLFDSRGLM